MNERQILDEYDKIDTRMLINLTNLLYNSEIKISLEEIRDCFSQGQLASKFWLIHELNMLGIDDPLQVLILGGWIGSLASLLFQHYDGEISRIASVDVDPKCEMIANYLNMDQFMNDWRFKAFTDDMHKIDYALPGLHSDHLLCFYPDYNTVINTSCEHIGDVKGWFEKIPNGKLVIVQSNNFFSCEQHVSCVKDLEEFKQQCQFSELRYEGVLHSQLYDRFMLIGYK